MKILLVTSTNIENRVGKTLANKHPNSRELTTGIGIPNTIFELQNFCQQHFPDLIINYGICGSFNKGCPKGAVFRIDSDQFADLGFYENQQIVTGFEKGFQNKNEFPFQEGKLLNNKSYNYQGPKASAITINTVNRSAKHLQMLRRKYNADLISMEGAAFFFTCQKLGIPNLQIRAVSNYVHEKDHKDWLIEEALHNLTIQLENFITSCQKQSLP